MRIPYLLPFLLPAGLTHVAGEKISDTPSSYSYVTRHNERLSPLLRSLCSTTDFFKYYKLNLFTRECPYFGEDGAFCGNRACAVDTLEEEDVPEVWRASVLGRLSGPTGTAASNLPLHTAPLKVKSPSGEDKLVLDGSVEKGETCVQDPRPQDDRNFCVPEDEDSDCVYVSLEDNEERYTGYHGSHARAIWGSIYRENCFEAHGNDAFEDVEEQSGIDGQSVSDAGFGEFSNSRQEFAQVLRDPLKSGNGNQDTCIEKRIFYRIISGMHASISTHICASYLNQLSGRWEPNSTCFDDRLRAHPDRVSNIYFNYVLVSRAIGKLKNYLGQYTFCSGDPEHDDYTSAQVNAITSLASDIHYDESPLFEDRLLKEDFRNRFRNISMLMDCVGCDKCRLWGKVQTAGYGTALKILFDESPKIELRRGEIVSLFNTYGRLSISLDALRLFNFSFPHTETTVEVSNDVVTQEEVILPPLENPSADHAGPEAPLAKLTKLAVGVRETCARNLALPSLSSIFRDLAGELRGFGTALKFIGKSYLDLPRNLWYHFFITRGPDASSFWDFCFAPGRGADDREL